GTGEIAQVGPPPEQPSRLEPKLPAPVPIWAKVAMLPLVLVLPLLCLITLIFRVAMRGLPPRTRFAWLSYLSTLLIVSGLLTSFASVLAIAFVPLPAIVSRNLNELDSRTTFPSLPSVNPLTAKEVSEELKPLVAVIAPARRPWFAHKEMPSSGFGAGVVLEATPEGYLILTARHVIDESLLVRDGSRALIAMATGTWAGGDVIARHKNLDLLLLWMPRDEGRSSFFQTVEPQAKHSEGENIFVIGHPQGL